MDVFQLDFQRILDSIRVGICVFKDGKFIYVNEAIEEISGYSKEEFEELDPFLLIHPEDRERIFGYTTRALNENDSPGDLEVRILRKDGTLRWVAFKPLLLGELILGTVFDITEIKEVKRKLKEREEMFRGISEESLQGIMVVRDGRIVYANKVMEVTGYTRDELVGKRVIDLIAKDFRKVTDEAYEDVMKGRKVTNVEVKYLTKSGEERWALINAIKIDHNDPAILNNILDITARKKLEMRIKRSEEKFRNLWDSVEDLIVVLDAEGRIRGCNRKVLQLSGLDRRELIGKKVSEFVNETWIEKIRELIRGEGRLVRVEIPVLTGDRTLWIEASANLIHDGEPLLQVVGRDITERKRMEEMLRESESKFRSLVERSVAGVYLIQDGVFKYVNPKLAEICGFKPEEMLNREVLPFIHPDYREIVGKNLDMRLHGSTEAINYTLKILTKDGEVRDVEVYGSKATIGGKPAVIGTLIDITELRKSEEKYRKIFHNSPVLIAILDESGVVVDCNPAMEKSIGTDPSGKNLFDLFPEEIAERRFKHLKKALKDNRNISFTDNNDGFFHSTFIPLELPEGKFCLAMVEDVTDLMNLNRLLRTINEINNIIVHENSAGIMLRRICSKLSSYDCHIIWNGNGEVTVFGEIQCNRFKNLAISYPIEITTDLFKDGFGLETLEDCSTCEKTCPVKENSYMIILPLFDGILYGTMILFKGEKPFESELQMLKTMAKDVTFALRSLEVAEQKDKAYRQINKNIEYFAYLLDAIRNPLTVIAGLAEIEESERSRLILEQVERIDEIIKKLDKGWIETERIRNYLRKAR